MGEHRDDSKAAAAEGGWRPDPRDERGRMRSRSEDEYSAEERTFSQSGGSGSQPGMGKRLATETEEDRGHFDRGHFGRETDKGEGKRSRSEGAMKHGARPK